MDIKTKEMYSEVYSILNLMNEKYIKRLPTKLYEMIRDNRLESYNPVYDPDILLTYQDCQKDTIAMLALLRLNYWCDTEEERDEIREILNSNSEKQSMVMRQQYSSQNMFQKINEEREKLKQEQESLNQTPKTEMTEYKRESFFTKIMNKIKFMIIK